MVFSIAIDGPAGSGKSTMAKILAEKMGAMYLDTGAMYRTVALKVIRMGKDTKKEEDVNSVIENLDYRVEILNGEQLNILDNENVNDYIRTPDVSIGASDVGVFPNVRHKLVKIQQELSKIHSVVMEGRDIGTYVLPDAEFKFFLTASVEERAKRRYLQMQQKGITADIEEIKRDIEYRDKNDSSRKMAPLKKADDAHIIDTTCLNIEQVVDEMMRYIHGK